MHNLNRVSKPFVIVFFILYLIILLDFTLFEQGFGRDITNILNWNTTSLEEYCKTSLNIIPFTTVKLIYNGVKSGAVTLSWAAVNLFGNFLLLFPFGFFLPYAFKFCRKFWNYFIIASVVSIFIELLQLLFLTGSCDIDDFLLNVLGAAIVFPLFRHLFDGFTEKYEEE